MKTQALFIVCMLFFIFPLQSQELSKEEKKALQKELRTMSKDLGKLKQMKETDDELGKSVAQKQTEVSFKKNQLDEIKAILGQKDAFISSQLDEINLRSRKLGKDQSRQVFFRVQIGAYRNKKLEKVLKQNFNFEIEKDETGFKKYMLGYFRSYWEAKKLSESLTEAGAQSFVVGYLDGQRVADLKNMPQEYF